VTGLGRRVGALGAGLLLLSGCGFRGAYSFNLPGGADVGDQPYTVQIQFADVLDLVPQSGVRVADVPVGRVTAIKLQDDWTAVVTVTVNGDVDLPANATAAIQQSSLLGEKYVELAAPTGQTAQGHLEDGALIPKDRTSRNVEVEELLGALSLVLNGGGLEKLQTISRELGQAMQGRESELKNTLDQLNTFIGGLDQQKEEINRALDSVNALAATLAQRTGTIEKALDTIGPGLDVLNQQEDMLVSMLQSLDRLGQVGTRIINQAGQNTYPFPSSSLTALNYRPDSRTGGYGLFTNMTATLNLDLREILCRYVVDPVTGALKIQPQELVGTTCGQAGTPPGNQQSTTTTTTSLVAVPGLDGIAGAAAAVTGGSGALPGLPIVSGGSQ
jgi:phospholipid/cholesterol/gamma-HCH transport system substrate-binding protein